MTLYIVSAIAVFIFSGLMVMAGLGAAFLFVPLFYYMFADQKLTDGDGIMAELKHRLSKFGIKHTTIQFECAACGQGANLSAASQEV